MGEGARGSQKYIPDENCNADMSSNRHRGSKTKLEIPPSRIYRLEDKPVKPAAEATEWKISPMKAE